MTKKDLIKKILELGKELEKANGFDAIMIINDMEIEVDSYTKQLPINDVFNLNNDTMTTEQNEIKSAEWSRDTLIEEIKRRQEMIISETNGIVRETMIANLLVGLQ